jgi:hypothetical protein
MPLPWLKDYKPNEETRMKIGLAHRGKFKINNENDINRIIFAYENGESGCSIARLHGVDQGTIFDLLRRHNVIINDNPGERSKRCRHCNKQVEYSDLDKSQLKYGHWICKKCESNRGVSKNRKMKLAVIEAYGRRCDCCGENRFEFLTIDHVKGGGNRHRRKIGTPFQFYCWLRRNNYPKDAFRLLCYNCNMSVGHFGYCPHRAH